MWMKKKFIIPALIVLVVIALVVYFFRKGEYMTGVNPIIQCTFTTPSTYGYNGKSFTGVQAYIKDCGVAECSVDDLPKYPIVESPILLNQSFITYNSKTPIPFTSTAPGVSVSASINISTTKGTFTSGNTYSIGIAMFNDAGVRGEFAYKSAIYTEVKPTDKPIYTTLGKQTACRSSPDGFFNWKDFSVDGTAKDPIHDKTVEECQALCTTDSTCTGISFALLDTVNNKGDCFSFIGGKGLVPYAGPGTMNETCYSSNRGRPTTIPYKSGSEPVRDLVVKFV